MKIIALTAVLTLGCTLASAQQYKVLYEFGGSSNNDGASSEAPLIFDRSGNLYGTTAYGGDPSCTGNIPGCGTVFELSPGSDGTWTETVLYTFSGPDGASPDAGLIFDIAGNLYGTTSTGGDTGGGSVFELSPPTQSGGAWTETVLYNFCSLANCADGEDPAGQLIFDSSGNLYGTTSFGGGTQSGVAFELSPGVSGWTEKILYNFCSVFNDGHCEDGAKPFGGVAFNKSGNLIGTTSEGGPFNADGMIFQLTPGSGGWSESVLTYIQPGQGALPGALSFDRAGNLYSTLGGGGGHRYGGVFQFDPRKESTKFFYFNTADGYSPASGVLVDSTRSKLYGTTYYGGQSNNGVVFQIAENGKETVLYDFCPAGPPCTDGDNPESSVIEDAAGNLYGTTASGGASRFGGVVYEITP